MEFFLLLILLFPLLVFLLLAAWVRTSKASKVAKESQDQIRGLASRVFNLENEVRLLKNILVQAKPGTSVLDVADQVAAKESKLIPEPVAKTETPPSPAAPATVITAPPPQSVAREVPKTGMDVLQTPSSSVLVEAKAPTIPQEALPWST